MPMYEHKESIQTLSEALDEYRASNATLLEERKMSDEAQKFFRCHDAVHAVFGCNTTLCDEAIVKICSIFGTSGGFGVLRGYRLSESKEIYRHLDWIEILTTTLKSIVLIPRTYFHCSCMQKPWPWDDFDRYLDLSLDDIRKEYGIRVAHQHEVSDGA